MPLIKLADAMDSVVEEVSQRVQEGGVATIGLSTGFYKLDEALGGLRNDFLYVIGGRPGSGKAQRIDTPIPTPTGFTEIGNLKIGDKVFDENGNVCTVTWVRNHEVDPVQYRITFDDGTYFDVCSEHLWLTSTRRSRKSQNEHDYKRQLTPNPNKKLSRDQTYKRVFPSVVTTQEIKDSLHVGSDGRLNHAIQVAAPLQLPFAELPIPPYTFGAWLGDGFAQGSAICGVDAEIFDRIRQDGFTVRQRQSDKIIYNIDGLVTLTKRLGVWQNKHIPMIYLRASYEQRLELLRGLMDTDGYISERGHCEITQKRYDLACQIRHLINTLGMKATLNEKRVKGTPYYQVRFSPCIQVFHLSRKKAKYTVNRRSTTQLRYVVDVTPIEPVLMRCITVDSPSHLYLTGEACVPTHNTALGLSIAMNVAEQEKNVLFISLEMSANLLALRLLSAHTGIPALDIEYGRLTREQLESVKQAREAARTLQFDLYDDSMISETLLERTQAYKERVGLDLLVVDYLSLLRDSASFGETERVSRIVGNLREVARACNIPVIAFAQLNREVEKREGNLPTLSDFRDSGAIEQDAGVAAFVYRPHYYAMMHDDAEPVEIEDDAQIILAKNRQGPTGTLKVKFYPKLMKWEDIRPEIQVPKSTNASALVAKAREGR